MFQDEVPFFKVLYNADLWKELRKWMYPNKKTSNIYNYSGILWLFIINTT